MKRLISIVLIMLSTVFASPVAALQLEDVCQNLDGYQSEVPHGYHLVITEDGNGNIIALECFKNGQH